jgi:hypothetical protein
MTTDFRPGALRAGLSAIRATTAKRLGIEAGVRRPKKVRVFFVGYMMMWFFAGIVLELVGYSLRDRRRAGPHNQQISECITPAQFMTFRFGAAPIC